MAFALPSNPNAPGKKVPNAPVPVKSEYAADGTLSSTLPIRPVNIPPPRDFEDDLSRFQKMLKPPPSAGLQAAGLEHQQPQPIHRAPSSPHPQAAKDTGTDHFVVPVGEGIQSAGMAYQEWKPGTAFSPTKPPVFSGHY